MNFEEARCVLSYCHKETLSDLSFDDAEVYWTFLGNSDEIASGYFGQSGNEVVLFDGSIFTGEEAQLLRSVCDSASYTWN